MILFYNGIIFISWSLFALNVAGCAYVLGLFLFDIYQDLRRLKALEKLDKLLDPPTSVMAQSSVPAYTFQSDADMYLGNPEDLKIATHGVQSSGHKHINLPFGTPEEYLKFLNDGKRPAYEMPKKEEKIIKHRFEDLE